MFEDIPVEVGIIYEGERIRRKAMHVELGGPKVQDKFELVRARELQEIEDGIIPLEDLRTEIGDLDPADMKKPAEQRKKALCNKIDAVIRQIEAGAYKGAIKKLTNDIKPKLDYITKQSWVVTELSDEIDLILRILEVP